VTRATLLVAALLAYVMLAQALPTAGYALPACLGARVKDSTNQTIGNVSLCDLGTVDGITTYSVELTQVTVPLSGRVGLCVGRNGEPYCGFLNADTAGFSAEECDEDVLAFTQGWYASEGAPRSVVIASDDLNTVLGVGRLTGGSKAKGC